MYSPFAPAVSGAEVGRVPADEFAAHERHLQLRDRADAPHLRRIDDVQLVAAASIRVIIDLGVALVEGGLSQRIAHPIHECRADGGEIAGVGVMSSGGWTSRNCEEIGPVSSRP